VNSNEPGSSGVGTAADRIEPTTETTTQHPAAVEIDKQASERAREVSERARAAGGRAAQQESGIEQVREVGASGATQAARYTGGGDPTVAEPGKTTDLYNGGATVFTRLARSGVGTIQRSSNDTVTEEDNFFSYRRATLRGEKDYGRGISVIMLRG